MSGPPGGSAIESPYDTRCRSEQSEVGRASLGPPTTPAEEVSNHTLRPIDNSRGAWLAPFVIVCLFIPSLVLVLGNRSLWDWDVALYGQQSVELYNTLVRSPHQWLIKMLTIGDDRPIAIAWLGQFFVPLGRLLDSVPSGLLLLTLSTELLSVLLLLVSLTRLFRSRWAAVLSCSFVVAGPLFVGMGLRYFVEPLQGLAVVWLVAVAAFHERLGRALLSCHIVAAVMFGLAVKPATGFFQAPVLLYLAYLWWRSPWTGPASRQYRAHLAVMAAATVLLTIGTVGWYWLHYASAIQHVVEASAGEAAEPYGTRAPWLTKLPYWLHELQRNFAATFLLPYFGGLFAAAVFTSRKQLRLSNPGDVLAGISLVWIFLTAAVFALNVNDHSRYLMALFPYVGILACWTLARFRSRLVWGAFAVLCVLQFSLVLAQASGSIPRLAQFPGYLTPWERSSEGLKDVSFAVDQTCEPGSITAVGVELPGFNPQALAFYAAIRHPQTECSYFGLPAHETALAPEAVWRRLTGRAFRYYVYRTFADGGEYEWLNKFSRVVLANMKESPAARARPDKSSAHVLVFESYHPLVPGDKVVRGFPPEGALPFGYLEVPQPAAFVPHEISIAGWTIGAVEAPGIDACFRALGPEQPTECRKAVLTRFGQPRPDVAKVYPDFPGSLKSGFRGVVDVRGFPKGRYQMTVVAHASQGSTREIATIPLYVKPFVPDTQR